MFFRSLKLSLSEGVHQDPPQLGPNVRLELIIQGSPLCLTFISHTLRTMYVLSLGVLGVSCPFVLKFSSNFNYPFFSVFL